MANDSALTDRVIQGVNSSGEVKNIRVNADGELLTTATDEVVTTATLTNVASSASSVQLLAVTTTRKAAYFFNDSTSAVYVKFGTTASATSFTVKIAAGGFYEIPKPVFTGKIDAIWDTANGSMRITELSA